MFWAGKWPRGRCGGFLDPREVSTLVLPPWWAASCRVSARHLPPLPRMGLGTLHSQPVAFPTTTEGHGVENTWKQP